MLLLEINIVFLLVLIIFSTFYRPFTQILASLKHMEEDMVLCLNERLLLGRLEKELTYETQSLSLIQQEGETGTFLTCQMLSVSRTKEFFLKPHKSGNGYSLYRCTKVVGRRKGINTLTPPHVKVLTFLVQPIDNQSVQMILELGLTTSERRRRTTRFIELLNGVLHEKK